jgi:hypothetical protein
LTGITIPDDAMNLRAAQQSLMVLWVYVRFEIPSDTLDGFLRSNGKMPQALTPNADLQRMMVTVGRGLDWWQVPDVPDGRFGENEGKVRMGQRDWRWTTTLCAAPKEGGGTTVYFVYTEEP